MRAEPPIDYRLSADASQLAGVFASMLYGRTPGMEPVRPREALSPKEAAAFDRWQEKRVRQPEGVDQR
jgi:hypothetical protein